MKIVRCVGLIFAILSITLCTSLFAQTPEFEVASIKPAPPLQEIVRDLQSGKRGIGSLQASITEGRVDFNYLPLRSMLMYAYTMKQHQINGPDWMATQAFEIHAKIPDGASKEQVPEMMQTLLAERFKLVAHRENKELPVYALMVSKDGPKLKESAEEVQPAEDSENSPPAENDTAKNKALSLKTPEGDVSIKQEGGGVVMNSPGIGQMRIKMNPGNEMSIEISKTTMAVFAELLTQFVDRPVVDKTGLTGSYQVELVVPLQDLLRMAQKTLPDLGISLPPGLGGGGSIVGAAPPGVAGLAASDPAGEGIFQAVKKLGLKLDSQKSPVETLVVDSIEKTPTAN
jgi:uncharacterized protein (TIGR03435 family)